MFAERVQQITTWPPGGASFRPAVTTRFLLLISITSVEFSPQHGFLLTSSTQLQKYFQSTLNEIHATQICSRSIHRIPHSTTADLHPSHLILFPHKPESDWKTNMRNVNFDAVIQGPISEGGASRHYSEAWSSFLLPPSSNKTLENLAGFVKLQGERIMGGTQDFVLQKRVLTFLSQSNKTKTTRTQNM